MYINRYNSLRFVADISKKEIKDTIFENLRTITQEGDMKTRQITPFFSSVFRALTV